MASHAGRNSCPSASGGSLLQFDRPGVKLIEKRRWDPARDIQWRPSPCAATSNITERSSRKAARNRSTYLPFHANLDARWRTRPAILLRPYHRSRRETRFLRSTFHQKSDAPATACTTYLRAKHTGPPGLSKSVRQSEGVLIPGAVFLRRCTHSSRTSRPASSQSPRDTAPAWRSQWPRSVRSFGALSGLHQYRPWSPPNC